MRSLLAVGLLLLPSACAVRWAETPPAAELKEQRARAIRERVLEQGQDGDWLVIRGYHVTDNLVATLTATPLSHAAMLDRGNEQVIEADASGVHVTPLAGFVEKSHRLMVIRPAWHSAQASAAALQSARALVGRKYDFLGLIGVNVPERYYCSELAIEAYRAAIPANVVIPHPVEPGQLYFWGSIVFDSGPFAG